jgi:hypothetical protein
MVGITASTREIVVAITQFHHSQPQVVKKMLKPGNPSPESQWQYSSGEGPSLTRMLQPDGCLSCRILLNGKSTSSAYLSLSIALSFFAETMNRSKVDAIA